ncbi:histidine kinase [Emticicia sp. W12TSBA100-4]|uniref:sensor histidine kinase n=1 Tax=Emticicia sp. W12TSBA100-4 TaxID=3160965 RepID=UPI003305D295
MLKRAIKSYYLHIITWTALFLLPFIGFIYEPNKISETNLYFIKTHFINILFLAGAFYLNLNYIAPKYFFEKSRLKFIALTFLVLGIYVFITYLTVRYSPLDEMKNLQNKNFIFFRFIIGPSITYSLCMLTSTMMFLYDEQARQKEFNKLIEIEKTAAELNMLKLQISPHFLFNTLNNIRWLIRKKSEQSEESVMKLSEILRYIIYEVEGSKVEFSREIEHLRNFIELQILRLPIEGNVVFKVDESINNFLIEPLLFIHFVENAFKYGIDSKNVPDIVFEFQKIPTGIIFHSRNKILLQKTNIQNEGIGLTNIQRRLALLYPDKHELTINSDEEYFDVVLRLELENN